MRTARSLEDEIAQRMLQARDRRTTLAGGAFPELSDINAYKVQERHMSMRYEDRMRLGWKIGYTSEAMRTQFNVSSPNYGPLWEPMLLSSGEAVAPSLIHPRVEPEIAVTLRRPLKAADLPSTEAGRTAAIADAISSYRCAIEVVDSIWSNYKFSWAENTADGSSAAHAVLGDFLPRDADLSDVRVTLEVDGAELSGRSETVMGNPLRAIEWLIAALSERGMGLEAGDVVLTGGNYGFCSPGSVKRRHSAVCHQQLGRCGGRTRRPGIRVMLRPHAWPRRSGGYPPEITGARQAPVVPERIRRG